MIEKGKGSSRQEKSLRANLERQSEKFGSYGKSGGGRKKDPFVMKATTESQKIKKKLRKEYKELEKELQVDGSIYSSYRVTGEETGETAHLKREIQNLKNVKDERLRLIDDLIIIRKKIDVVNDEVVFSEDFKKVYISCSKEMLSDLIRGAKEEFKAKKIEDQIVADQTDFMDAFAEMTST